MTNSADEVPAAPMYQVWDTSATHSVRQREHEIIFNGEIETIHFEYNKPTLMPFEKAIKFRQEGFIVKDPNGFQVVGPNKQVDTITDKLAPDEVIARLDELTIESLIVRAVMRPGGEHYSKSSSKTDLIKFLLKDKGVKPARRGRPTEDLIDDEPMSDEQLRNMLPGEDDAAQSAHEPDEDDEPELPYDPE